MDYRGKTGTVINGVEARIDKGLLVMRDMSMYEKNNDSKVSLKIINKKYYFERLMSEG